MPSKSVGPSVDAVWLGDWLRVAVGEDVREPELVSDWVCDCVLDGVAT